MEERVAFGKRSKMNCSDGSTTLTILKVTALCPSVGGLPDVYYI